MKSLMNCENCIDEWKCSCSDKLKCLFEAMKESNKALRRTAATYTGHRFDIMWREWFESISCENCFRSNIHGKIDWNNFKCCDCVKSMEAARL